MLLLVQVLAMGVHLCLPSFICDSVSKAGRQIDFLLSVFSVPLSGGTDWGYTSPIKKYFPDYAVLSAVNCKQTMSVLDQQSKKNLSFS